MFFRLLMACPSIYPAPEAVTIPAAETVTAPAAPADAASTEESAKDKE